jgi:hypothetical protein
MALQEREAGKTGNKRLVIQEQVADDFFVSLFLYFTPNRPYSTLYDMVLGNQFSLSILLDSNGRKRGW